MKCKKKRIRRGIVAVLACMLSTAFFSMNVEAATPEITYDPNATKEGYHLEISDQFQCDHDPSVHTRTIYTTMTGLTPTADQVISRIVNEGLDYSVDSYTCPPVGIGANKIGNTAVAIHVSNVGNGLNGRLDAVLASPYEAVNGYAGYTYYWNGFSRCFYTGKDYYTGGGHTWLGDSAGTVGINEVVRTSYSHIVTRYKFVPNNYTVVYNGNGATTGSMANQSVSYDQTFNLTANAYQRDGYRFTGWNTSPDGSGQSFSNGQAVSNLTSADGGVVTLYAQWTPITYTVNFDGNGATSGSTPVQSCTFGIGGYLNTNGFKKQYGVNYDGNGGTSEKESDIADAIFNGWQDNNTMYYKGMYFNYYGFDAPYYINRWGDVKAAFGYNKYAALNHWYTYIVVQGKESRQSAPQFNVDYYIKYGGSDLKAAFGTNRLAYVSHWMSAGIYEGRKGAASVDTTTSDLYPNRAWVANLATRQGETVTLTADWTPGSVTLPTATRPGYQFAGWYTETEGGTFIGNAGETYTPTANGGTLYAHWDECPQIEAVDRYFSLDFAQKGKITEEELLSTASATDREDGVLENRTSTQVAEVGINGSLSLYGYAATDFTQMTDSGSISITYKAVDSIGNTVYKTVTVFITDTEPLEQTDFQYTRFINEKYYEASYENGGFHPDSIWRNNPEYADALERALANLKNETPVESYRITKNENESVE